MCTHHNQSNNNGNTTLGTQEQIRLRALDYDALNANPEIVDRAIVSTAPLKNKEERYSRVPRLSDTRYSKGNGDMQAAKRN